MAVVIALVTHNGFSTVLQGSFLHVVVIYYRDFSAFLDTDAHKLNFNTI